MKKRAFIFFATVLQSIVCLYRREIFCDLEGIVRWRKNDDDDVEEKNGADRNGCGVRYLSRLGQQRFNFFMLNDP